MTCSRPKPKYTRNEAGIKLFANEGDGKMSLSWLQAFPDPSNYKVVYNIYFSTLENDVISENVKFVSISPSLNCIVSDFTPNFNAQQLSLGQVYFAVVRATEFDPAWYNISLLPQDESQNDPYLFVYPESMLAADLDGYSLIIPLSDVSMFPAYGVVEVGYELIRYIGKDLVNNYLLASERGFLNTNPRIHQQNGWDGYNVLDGIVRFWKGLEEDNIFIIQEQCKFTNPTIPFLDSSGYRDQNLVGIVTTDNHVSDEHLIQSPFLDYVGWRRTNPKTLFDGSCIDSYIGGENFCADSKLGINRQLRGIPLEYQALRREEALLNDIGTGENCVLLNRLWDGITCRCMEINQELPDPRCSLCYGTGYIGGYNQFMNPRESSRTISIRFGTANEDLKRLAPGLESDISFPCWTIGAWSLRDSDVIIRYNLDGTEEYRYSVLDCTRNKLLFSQYGNQHFTAKRIVKTSMIYSWKPLSNAEFLPSEIKTTVGLMKGPNGVSLPHVHSIVVSESIVNLSQINQFTSLNLQHNHRIENGIILETLGHSHSIILP